MCVQVRAGAIKPQNLSYGQVYDVMHNESRSRWCSHAVELEAFVRRVVSDKTTCSIATCQFHSHHLVILEPTQRPLREKTYLKRCQGAAPHNLNQLLELPAR